MTKILHVNIFRGTLSGVLRQLSAEVSAAEELRHEGIHWETKAFCLEAVEESFIVSVQPSRMFGLIGRLISFAKLSFTAFRWMLSVQDGYDFVLLRYNSSDVIQWWFARSFKRVYTIHHSFELEEVASIQGPLIGLRVYLERVFGARTLKHVSGVVGVTREIAEHEQKRCDSHCAVIEYPNGIDVDNVKCYPDERGGCPKFVMIASRFNLWHGIDLLFQAFGESRVDCELYVVGHISDELSDMASEDSRIRFLGSLEQEALAKVVAQCDVGLSSFAMHRFDMTEACTLKVRGYLASGLAVLAGHRDVAFDLHFPFYRNADVSLDALAEYAIECRDFSRESIREASRPFIDKVEMMRRLISKL